MWTTCWDSLRARIVAMVRVFSVIGALGLACVCLAEGDAAKAFEKLKSLVGSWTSDAGKVEYKLTGAGTALVETQFPGEPHEMVSVYHLDGDKLVMTHYCAAGNQPRMKLVKSSDRELHFGFDGGSNITKEGPHMHRLVITFNTDGSVESLWSSKMGDKPGGDIKFVMKRDK